VVGEGAVVRAFSKATKEVTRAAEMYRGQEFTVGDINDAVECSRRTVRRVLNEHTELGYLEKHETKTGLANEFQTVEEPGDGEIELPELDEPFATEEGETAGARGQAPADPADSSLGVSSTGFVWVIGVDERNETRYRAARTILPAPAATNLGDSPPIVAD
jgi:hypothetical protein